MKSFDLNLHVGSSAFWLVSYILMNLGEYCLLAPFLLITIVIFTHKFVNYDNPNQISNRDKFYAESQLYKLEALGSQLNSKMMKILRRDGRF